MTTLTHEASPNLTDISEYSDETFDEICARFNADITEAVKKAWDIKAQRGNLFDTTRDMPKEHVEIKLSAIATDAERILHDLPSVPAPTIENIARAVDITQDKTLATVIQQSTSALETSSAAELALSEAAATFLQSVNNQSSNRKSVLKSFRAALKNYQAVIKTVETTSSHDDDTLSPLSDAQENGIHDYISRPRTQAEVNDHIARLAMSDDLYAEPPQSSINHEHKNPSSSTISRLGQKALTRLTRFRN